MAFRRTYYYVEDNPGVETTDNALATDPLHLDPEQLPKVEDPLDQDDCGQDPLHLEDFVQGSQHHTGFAEGPVFDLPVVRVVPVQPGCSAYFSQDANFAPTTDLLRVEPELQAKSEVPVKQEDCVEDPFQIEDFVQDAQCGLGNDDPFSDIPVVTVLSVDPGCAAYPSDHDRPGSDLLHEEVTRNSKYILLNDHASGSASTSLALMCHICDISFRVPSELKRHKRTMHCQFECVDCNVTFNTLLTKHRTIHSQKSKLKISMNNVERYPGTKKACRRSQQYSKKSLKDDAKKSGSAKNAFQCDKCEMSFRLAGEFKVHKRTVHRLFECTKCDKTYTTNRKLWKHSLSHRTVPKKEGEYFPCNICPKIIDTKEGFDSHMAEHENGKRIKADVCSHSITGYPHRCKQKDAGKSYTCRHCGMVFSSALSLDEHVFTHPEQPRETCPICESLFRSKARLAAHLRMNACRREKCNMCFKRFFTKGSLIAHKAEHAAERNIKCDVCPKVLANRQSLNSHVRNHTEGKLQCRLCPRSFHTNGDLKVHISRHACKVCGLEFKSLADPAKRKHMLTHNVINASRFKCGICGRKVCDKYALKIHMRRHFRDQRVNCSLCMNSYSQKDGLEYHMRTRHASEREFKCEICGRSFDKEDSLTLHKFKRHEIEPISKIIDLKTIEKTYKCSLCPKTYYLKGFLTLHMQAKHNCNAETVCVCEVCGMVFEEQNDLKLHWLKHIPLCCKVCKKPICPNAKDQEKTSAVSLFCSGCVSNVNLVENESSSIKLLQLDPTDSPSGTDAVTSSNDGSIVQASTRVITNIMPDVALNTILDADNLVQSYSCNFCSIDIFLRTEFDSHMLTHLGAPPNNSANKLICNEILSASVVTNSNSMAQHITCKFCGEYFTTKHEFDSHQESHLKLKLNRHDAKLFRKRIATHEVGSYQCNNCSEKFFVRNEFKQHLKKQTLSSYRKLICYKSNSERSSQMPFKCDICYKGFFYKCALKQHIRLAHLNSSKLGEASKATFNELLRCDVCSKTFNVKAGLISHLRSHALEEMGLQEANKLKSNLMKCSFVGETFATNAGMLTHQWKHNRNDIEPSEANSKPLKCTICNSIFLAEAALLSHLQSHTALKADQQPIYESMHTEAILTEKPSQTAHLKLNGPMDEENQRHKRNLEELIRNDCDTILTAKPGPSAHIKSNVSNDVEHQSRKANTGQLKCSICDATFSFTSGLLSHLRSHAAKEMRLREANNQSADLFKCSICNTTFTGKHEMLSHMRSQGQAIKANAEELISMGGEATLNAKSVLSTRHQSQDGKDFEQQFSKTKSGEWKCSICNAVFKLKLSVKAHLRSHAAKEMRLREAYNLFPDLLKCSICYATFTEKSGLLSHLRKHDRKEIRRREARGEQTDLFKCHICNKTFAVKSGLSSHLFAHGRKELRLREAQGLTEGLLKCSICEATFVSKPGLTVHLKSHAGEEMRRREASGLKTDLIKCSFCDATFVASSGLSVHLKTHALDEPRLKEAEGLYADFIKCSASEGTVSAKAGPTSHLQIHDLNEVEQSVSDKAISNKLTCSICNASFETESLLLSHKQSHYAKNLEQSGIDKAISGEFECSIYNTAFNAEPGPSSHPWSHIRNSVELRGSYKVVSKELTCSTCNVTFKTKEALSYHLRSHAATNDAHIKGGPAVPSKKRKVQSKSIAGELRCSICDARYKSKAGLASHLRSHSDNPPFFCEICGVFVSCKKSHMSKHSSIKAYSCHMCKLGFVHPKGLTKHLETHIRSMRFRCDICKDFFKIKHDIEKHLTSVHKIALDAIDFSKHAFSAPSAPRFKCDECGLDYAQQGTLRTHIKTHHSNAPVLQCVVCNKTFARKSNLVNHMNLHTSVYGEFECKVCKRRFPTFQRMNAHLKNHLTVKRFKCKLCPGAFRSLNELSQHMTVHTRARNFECALCGRKYKNKTSIVYHMKSHFEKDK